MRHAQPIQTLFEKMTISLYSSLYWYHNYQKCIADPTHNNGIKSVYLNGISKNPCFPAAVIGQLLSWV